MKKLLTILALFAILTQTAYAYTNTYSASVASAASQYFSITNAAQTGLNVTSALTMQGWFKFTTLPANGTFMNLAQKTWAGAGRQYTWELFNNSGTYQLLVYYYSGSGTAGASNSCAGNVTVSTGTWYNFAATITASTETMHEYSNGSDISCTPNTNNNTSIQTGTGVFEIANGADGFLNGQVDEFLFYSADIGTTQVNNNYTTPCSAYATNLVSQWHFDANPNDSVGSNNLTENNSLTYTGDVAFTCAVPAIPGSTIFMRGLHYLFRGLHIYIR